MPERICSVRECDRPTGVPGSARGLCQMHYRRWRTTGSTELRPKPEPRTCEIAGCDAAHLARGWCTKHYQRWRKTGTTESRKIDPVQKFWGSITLPESPDECWLWDGPMHESGYGNFFYPLPDGRRRLAHRLMWEWTNGPIPKGLFVCHRCDVKTCVNPEHLYLATSAQNTRDAARSGLMPRGEDQWCSRLTETQVRSIRRRAAAGETQRKLAEEFGCARGTIANIIQGKTWGWLS